MDIKNFAMSLKATFPILVVMKYSSLHSTFFSVKSKVKPPVVISGAPKNFTTLPTTAIKSTRDELMIETMPKRKIFLLCVIKKL